MVKKIFDSSWIDLFGGKDYLPLKKPLRVKKTNQGFYIEEFELMLPKNCDLKQIKKSLREKYESLLFRETISDEENDKERLWIKIVESDIVDYDAFWDMISTGNKNLFRLVNKKGNKRGINFIGRNYLMDIPKKYEEYFNELPLGTYQASFKYVSENEIREIDELSPINLNNKTNKNLTKIIELLEGDSPFIIRRE